MPRCESCGNTYDKTFEITVGGTTYVVDSFECAIQLIAPRCSHCRVPIISQGLEARGQYFCSAHCARQSGIRELADRGPEPGAAHV